MCINLVGGNNGLIIKGDQCYVSNLCASGEVCFGLYKVGYMSHSHLCHLQGAKKPIFIAGGKPVLESME